jgi:hypothetical protein
MERNDWSTLRRPSFFKNGQQQKPTVHIQTGWQQVLYYKHHKPAGGASTPQMTVLTDGTFKGQALQLLKILFKGSTEQLRNIIFSDCNAMLIMICFAAYPVVSCAASASACWLICHCCLLRSQRSRCTRKPYHCRRHCCVSIAAAAATATGLYLT